MRRTSIVVVLATVLVGSYVLFAQEQTGRIGVQVTDHTGAVVPRAQVGFRPELKAVAKNPETDEGGNLLLAVPPGEYEMFVSYPSFKPWAQKVQVRQGKTENIKVVLELPNEAVIVHVDTPNGPIDLNAAYVPPRPVPVAIQVTDKTGAVVPYAQVWVDATQGLLETDEGGRLNLKLIPDDFYVSVTRPLFARWRERIHVAAGMPLIRVILTAMPVPNTPAP